MKKSYKGFPIYLLIILGVFIVAQLFSSSFNDQQGEQIDAGTLLTYIDEGHIDAVALQDGVAYARQNASTIPDGALSSSMYDFCAVVSDTFVETCRQLAARRLGVPLDEVTELDLGFKLIYLPPQATPWLLDMLPYIIVSIGLMAVFLLMMRQQTGGGGGKMMNFGHSPARVFEPGGNRVTFTDVAGAVEEKEEMQELVEFLKNPRRFTAVGARIPKGVLL
ncbi:MAG TPA: hypothetical protein IAC19_01840, partial [Candidatus Ventricola gallistercoris]|nr:hypothetical protein [Candidatus Ventricola gallistercoris]